MNRFFSASPFGFERGIAFVRIATGLMLAYHGFEVFDPETMNGYMTWESFAGLPAGLMVYAGKGSEFVVGVLFCLGLVTRIACLIAIGTFLYITFFIGQGRFWYEDQHPFMFALMALALYFTGPGEWSVDRLVFRRSE
jgi:putative oxidoreductase